MSKPYILVVDDQPDIRSMVKEILEDEGYEVGVAQDGASARHARRERRPDLILLDVWMPDIDGITLLKEWSEGKGLSCPVVMISGHGTVETAVEATRLGAYDFIEKPLSLSKLLLAVERALEAHRLYRENVGLRHYAHVVVEPVGRSAVIEHLREQVKRIAQHDTWVLFTGEPGSGKEVFARYLHANSARRNGPFIDVGVASIARENSSVELFGSEEGARIHYGLLEQANGGVLFLDEVGDMELETQGRLLSALETGSFLRVGGSEPVMVDVRVVAATHRSLEQDVQMGRFREDLYYHLNVVPMRLPPLMDHREDIPELLNYYLDSFAEHEKLPFRRFTVAAQNRLRNYSWPGNIRELKNLVQRLLILGAGEEISLQEVESALGTPPPRAQQGATNSPISFDLPLREAREQFERLYLEHQLQESGGSVGKLAKLVGMERTHLYRKLRALGVELREKK
jgi:two-component system nitrogen regulation response regulator NtrX